MNDVAQRYCTNCGTPLEAGARFCSGCGSPAGALLYGVPTIELAGARYELASFWRRAAAALIDGVLLALVYVPVYAALLWGDLREAYGQPFDPEFPQPYFDGLVAVFNPTGRSDLLLMTVAFSALGVALEFYGWTPAKAMLGMRVLREDGRRPGLVHGFARSTIKAIGGTLLLGYLWAAWDPKRQTWHDKAARTFVVRVGTLVLEPRPQPPTGAGPPVTLRLVYLWAGLGALYLAYLTGANYAYGTFLPGTWPPSYAPPTPTPVRPRVAEAAPAIPLVRLIDVRDATRHA